MEAGTETGGKGNRFTNCEIFLSFSTADSLSSTSTDILYAPLIYSQSVLEVSPLSRLSTVTGPSTTRCEERINFWDDFCNFFQALKFLLDYWNDSVLAEKLYERIRTAGTTDAGFFSAVWAIPIETEWVSSWQIEENPSKKFLSSVQEIWSFFFSFSFMELYINQHYWFPFNFLSLPLLYRIKDYFFVMRRELRQTFCIDQAISNLIFPRKTIFIYEIFIYQNSFADIARLLSDFFRDLDVVPSDVVAGLVLLRKFQKIERELIVKQRKNDTYEFLSGVPVTPRTKFLSLTEDGDLGHFQLAIHYMHFALAAYGWPMFLVNHSTGLCQLCTR